ncbi:hypothetical protein PAECIP111892_02367 [Paenibacillus auburnensis]|uniref:DUF4044 domain-containing protein n=1 Tax=Paenibacillus auburnensis TaxID=2905649 RepID=A0ABN8G1N4_9BACL|nr:hypothetical protein PAECIP111892_02367 [Paenibacillus auburnensis]
MFKRSDKIFIFILLGLAVLFIVAFFVIRYIVLHISFAP